MRALGRACTSLCSVRRNVSSGGSQQAGSALSVSGALGKGAELVVA